MRQLEPERVGQLGVDLEGVPEPELVVGEPRLLGEVLVEQLADHHRVRGVDGVGGGQVVVLAGVDDDPGAGVDLAGEALVDEGADRVDVAEEDPVHRVVEHHVEALEPGQRGDLGHAQPGGVVGQPDVAAELRATSRPGRRASAGSSPAWRTCRRSPRGSRPRARSRAATDRSSGSPRRRRRPRGRRPGPAGCPRRCRRWRRSGRSTAAAAGRRCRRISRVRARARRRSMRRDPGRRGARAAAQRAGSGVAPAGRPERAPSPTAACCASAVRSQSRSRRSASQTGSGDPVLQADLAAHRVDEVVHPRAALGVGADRGRPGAARRARPTRWCALGQRRRSARRPLGQSRAWRTVAGSSRSSGAGGRSVIARSRAVEQRLHAGLVRNSSSAMSAWPGTYPLPMSIVTSAARPSAPSAAAENGSPSRRR